MHYYDYHIIIMPFNSTEKRDKWYDDYKQTDSFKYSVRINGWKQKGIISNDWGVTYKSYMEMTNCQKCNVEFSTEKERSNKSKVLDHNHSIKNSHNVRLVLCHKCNVSNDEDMKFGEMYITWEEDRKRWNYRSAKINGKRHQRRFKYFIQAVIYKKEFELIKNIPK